MGNILSAWIQELRALRKGNLANLLDILTYVRRHAACHGRPRQRGEDYDFVNSRFSFSLTLYRYKLKIGELGISGFPSPKQSFRKTPHIGKTDNETCGITSSRRSSLLGVLLR
jgi:hypothetical protein